VLHLEIAQGSQQLRSCKEDLCKQLKLKSLMLSSLQRTIARQESCILWLNEGDAPTRFFHIDANSWRIRKCICSLMHEGHTLVVEHRKAKALFGYYDSLMGEPAQKTTTINLELLNVPQMDLSHLTERFTEEEVLQVIHSLPPDKTSGLNGFTMRFLQTSWDIIHIDLMGAFDAFWHLDTRDIHAINEALMVLLPKSSEEMAIKDFRPISLIHVLGKLFFILLPNRLAPRLVN
jgi:hypothetical protein